MQRLLLLCVLGLCLIGCGGAPATDATVGASDDAPTDAVAAPASDVADGGPATAAEAPFGTVTLVGGERLDGAEYTGDNLALWFWAPW